MRKEEAISPLENNKKMTEWSFLKMKFKIFEIQMFGSIKISNNINSQNNYSSHSPSQTHTKLGRTQKVTL